MEIEEKVFTEESFETHIKDIAKGICKLRAEIREELLKSIEPSQKQRVQEALGSYGKETPQDIEPIYNDFLQETIKDFYSHQVVIGILEYSREFGTEKVLALKDNVFADDEQTARYLTKRIHTFEEFKDFSSRDMQTLMWGLDWLDLVRALKIASEPIKQKFKRNMSSKFSKPLEEQIKASPATLEESLEAQRRILRTASALGLF